MTKPLGMTADFRIIRPSTTEDKIWEAVREAIASGWSAKDFRLEAANAWEDVMREELKAGVAELRKP